MEQYPVLLHLIDWVDSSSPVQSFHLVQPTLGYQAEGEFSFVSMLVIICFVIQSFNLMRSICLPNYFLFWLCLQSLFSFPLHLILFYIHWFVKFIQTSTIMTASDPNNWYQSSDSQIRSNNQFDITVQLKIHWY